ncbi:MAG: APC family permease [Actinobacteria bacterium]|nr:APC family permease [Actinomycetota bacterium]NBY14886.1 APC family permease [Actinomycetota bacterium]
MTPQSSDRSESLDFTEEYQKEKANLQKHFGRREILFFTICTLVGVDTLGSIAFFGPQAFSWLVILAITFFIPSALLFAELGTAFPEEGGPYLWARLAFGRLTASINNFFYWVTNPVWFGGTLTVVALTAIETFFLGGASLSSTWFYLLGFAFIWVGTFASILSFKVGKWVPILGAFARFILLGIFSLTIIMYASKFGIHGPTLGSFKVTWPCFVAIAGLILFNYVGFENPNSAGDEMKDSQRDVPYAVFRSAIAAILLYGIPILGIILVLPADKASSLEGFIDAIKETFTVFGRTVAEDGTVSLAGWGTVMGGFAAVLLVLCVLSSGVAWLMGSDRALAVSGYDGAAPRWLGVFSEKYGTPVRVNMLSGILSSIIFVLARVISEGNTAKYFTVVLGIAVSTTLMSYIAIFPALWKLRVSHPDVPRVYRAPFAKFLSVWLTLIVSFATVQLLAPGLGAGWFSGDYLPDGWEEAEKWKYMLTVSIPLAIFVLIGVIFWAVGKRNLRQKSTIYRFPFS